MSLKVKALENPNLNVLAKTSRKYDEMTAITSFLTMRASLGSKIQGQNYKIYIPEDQEDTNFTFIVVACAEYLE